MGRKSGKAAKLGDVPALARGLEVLEFLAQYPQGKSQ